MYRSKVPTSKIGWFENNDPLNIRFFEQVHTIFDQFEMIPATFWGCSGSETQLASEGRHGLEKHSQLAEALLKNVLPQISQEPGLESCEILCRPGLFDSIPI